MVDTEDAVGMVTRRVVVDLINGGRNNGGNGVKGEGDTVDIEDATATATLLDADLFGSIPPKIEDPFGVRVRSSKLSSKREAKLTYTYFVLSQLSLPSQIINSSTDHYSLQVNHFLSPPRSWQPNFSYCSFSSSPPMSSPSQEKKTMVSLHH
ncbi:hypothetical protein Fmac_012106 [Flemingia macrophylla]|uniref:Uncharacterized protein n=1 Tax=Flemingia macrophylla TaxID=520843 RepID=A0ABD1MPD4_9FABA